MYNKFHLLTNKTKSKQISFRIGINKDIQYPIENIAFVMNDSEFNITWYPQEKHWEKKPKIKSLWSGTIIDFQKKGKLFNKNAEELDNDQLKEEIISQILRSESFQKMIFDNNGFYLDKNEIEYFEIWYEWEFIKNKQEQYNKKWVNNVYNEKYRPHQKTDFSNLFLSGSHTKTSINIWSMEGAVESGKITSNYILDKYNLKNIKSYTHNDPSFLNIFKKIDNILYEINLPNILNIIIILLIFYILKYLYKKKNN